MRFVPVSELKGGEILAVNIINANMQVLMREGSALSIKMIERIRKLGIDSVYVSDMDMSDFIIGSVSDTIDSTVRNSSVNHIKMSFERFQARVDKQKQSLKYGDTGESLFGAVKLISSDLVDEILNAKDVLISMQDIKNATDYNYQHSVNIAVLSLIIGTELGLTLQELEDLAFGSLLLNIGFNWVDHRVLLKEKTLTDSELASVRSHVKVGYEYINSNTTFNAHVKSIIMHHHERMDGSGYPKGLKASDIHPLAKIVMVADVYDALTSDRPHRQAYNPHEAIEYIMARAGTLFDFNIASIFARKVVPYPVGTYVKLSNNQKGIITENNRNHPLRPVVRTFGKSTYTDETSYKIDLLEVNNITIEKVIYSLG